MYLKGKISVHNTGKLLNVVGGSPGKQKRYKFRKVKGHSE